MKDVDSMLDKIIHCLDDAKAIDIKTIDVTKKTSITDYMVIASGTSQRHLRALADKALEMLKAENCKYVIVEGYQDSDWVLLDLVDVVIHLFLPQTRVLYDLETLWSIPTQHSASS